MFSECIFFFISQLRCFSVALFPFFFDDRDREFTYLNLANKLTISYNLFFVTESKRAAGNSTIGCFN